MAGTRVTTAGLARQAERAIAAAEAARSKLPPSVLTLGGFSSLTVRHFLNNLCGFAAASHLGALGHGVAWERELFTRGWFRQHLTGEWEGTHWFNGIFVAVVRRPAARP
jgi:hypothetical protein